MTAQAAPVAVTNAGYDDGTQVATPIGWSLDGTTTTFEDPQNADPPSDLTGFNEWSPNLSDWHASGSGPVGGPTVSFVPNTVGTTSTATATASEPLESLFLRVGVMQD